MYKITTFSLLALMIVGLVVELDSAPTGQPLTQSIRRICKDYFDRPSQSSEEPLQKVLKRYFVQLDKVSRSQFKELSFSEAFWSTIYALMKADYRLRSDDFADEVGKIFLAEKELKEYSTTAKSESGKNTESEKTKYFPRYLSEVPSKKEVRSGGEKEKDGNDNSDVICASENTGFGIESDSEIEHEQRGVADDLVEEEDETYDVEDKENYSDTNEQGVEMEEDDNDEEDERTEEEYDEEAEEKHGLIEGEMEEGSEEEMDPEYSETESNEGQGKTNDSESKHVVSNDFIDFNELLKRSDKIPLNAFEGFNKEGKKGVNLKGLSSLVEEEGDEDDVGKGLIESIQSSTDSDRDQSVTEKEPEQNSQREEVLGLTEINEGGKFGYLYDSDKETTQSLDVPDYINIDKSEDPELIKERLQKIEVDEEGERTF